MVRLMWTLLHMKVDGNDGADSMAKMGREAHQYNQEHCRSEQVNSLWDSLGLQLMASDVLDSFGASSSSHQSVGGPGW